MDIQNGFDKALMQQMGIGPSGTKFKTPSLQWYEQEQDALAEIALKYGIEISSEKVLEPGKKEHESVKAYKARMESIQELDDERKFVRNKRKSLTQQEKNVNEREKSVAARERAVGVKEAEMMNGASQRLLEAQRATEEAEAEKERLERELEALRAEKRELDWENAALRAEKSELDGENAALRAEKSELDGEVLSDMDKLVLKQAKTRKMQNGESFYNGFKNLVLKERAEKRTKNGIPDAVSDYGSSKNYQPNQASKQNNRQLER